MAKLIAALAVVALMGTGCAYLQIDTDERLWGVTLVPKIVGRIMWAVPTLGTSELLYACARRRGGGPRNFDVCGYGDGGYSESYSQAPVRRRDPYPDPVDDGTRQAEPAQKQPSYVELEKRDTTVQPPANAP